MACSRSKEETGRSRPSANTLPRSSASSIRHLPDDNRITRPADCPGAGDPPAFVFGAPLTPRDGSSPVPREVEIVSADAGCSGDPVAFHLLVEALVVG